MSQTLDTVCFAIAISCMMCITCKDIVTDIKTEINDIKKDVKKELAQNKYTGRDKSLYILSRILFGKDEE